MFPKLSLIPVGTLLLTPATITTIELPLVTGEVNVALGLDPVEFAVLDCTNAALEP